ncbi:MAG: hypothetical protein DMF59_05320 [Acidobacteria bacterium]|nr:MAG: hypothetical protein DMF59_05320 [Acidobacteriota bacterium]
MIWREHRVLLIVLAVLLVANAIFFFTYRVQYEARLKALYARLQQSEDGLQRARNKRLQAEQAVASYRKVQTDLQMLYNSSWATEPERLTRLYAEIKRLAAASGIVMPKTFSFARTEDKEMQKTGGIGTVTVTISFTAQGTYQQLRRLINRLELSNQFVILDAINLGSGSSPDNLTLNVRLKTLFREPARSTMMVSKEM